MPSIFANPHKAFFGASLRDVFFWGGGASVEGLLGLLLREFPKIQGYLILGSLYLIIRIRLFGVLYKGSPILETPIQKLGALYQGSPGAFYGKFRVSYRVLSVTFWGIYVAVFCGSGVQWLFGLGAVCFSSFLKHLAFGAWGFCGFSVPVEPMGLQDIASASLPPKNLA